MMKDITNPIYHNEDKARHHLETLRWGDELSNQFCPSCGCTDRIKPTPMKSKPSLKKPEPKVIHGYYHCADCRTKFTVRTGTIYERSHIPLHKWVLATQLLCSSKKGMSAHQLHRMLGVTYKTAWFMSHRIRESMNIDHDDTMGNSEEPVQADETYFGRKDVVVKRTKHGKPSHSSKMSVVSLVSKGKARSFHVDTATIESVSEILHENVSRDAELHTDESRLYTQVGADFKQHKTVKHSAGEYMKDGAHVNNAENYFSIFKRGMRGVYQRCSEKHLQRYLNEFDFRYNTRDITDFERGNKVFENAEGKRLTYNNVSKTISSTV